MSLHQFISKCSFVMSLVRSILWPTKNKYVKCIFSVLFYMQIELINDSFVRLLIDVVLFTHSSKSTY